MRSRLYSGIRSLSLKQETSWGRATILVFLIWTKTKVYSLLLILLENKRNLGANEVHSVNINLTNYTALLQESASIKHKAFFFAFIKEFVLIIHQKRAVLVYV